MSLAHQLPTWDATAKVIGQVLALDWVIAALATGGETEATVAGKLRKIEQSVQDILERDPATRLLQRVRRCREALEAGAKE
jgi:hypothetical protein